jgi:hypothetical protein
MRELEALREDRLAWPLLSSLAIHVLLAVTLRFSVAPSPAQPEEDSIAVEIVTIPIAPSQGLPPDLPPKPTDGGPAVTTESRAPALATPGSVNLTALPMIRPARLLSAEALADPRSREGRETLRHLVGDERVIQLCDLEAISQVHAWNNNLQPDRLVAYAMTDTRVSGKSVQADGAAFRSNGRWYNMRFRCEVTLDRKSVTSFEFVVGDPIPQSEWLVHNLPPVH